MAGSQAVRAAYLNPSSIDWSRARSAVYEVRQSLRYEYPGPIEDVRQLLVLVPRDKDGAQSLLDYGIDVLPEARPRYSDDRFGNRVCQLYLARVENALEFQVHLRVERWPCAALPVEHDDDVQSFTLPSPLTEPTPDLRDFAATLITQASTGDPSALVEAINTAVYERIAYTQGVTGVRTTAQDAYTGRQGVCQDYAHLMLTLCRIAGLPARYVSGHLLGEGAMHAWVQVLVPPATGEPAGWVAFDPTHKRRAGMRYITIAVGRDFGDVSPTRGTFRAPYGGHLAASWKDAGIVSVDLGDEGEAVA